MQGLAEGWLRAHGRLPLWYHHAVARFLAWLIRDVIRYRTDVVKDNLEKCFKAISKAIRELQDKPLSDRKLKAAKKQLLGQLAISSESGEAQCLSMGKSLLAFGRVASSAENKAAIEAVTSADLQSLARRIFSPDNISRLIYL